MTEKPSPTERAYRLAERWQSALMGANTDKDFQDNLRHAMRDAWASGFLAGRANADVVRAAEEELETTLAMQAHAAATRSRADESAD